MIETTRIVYSLRAALVVLLLMLALGISAVRLFLPQIAHYKTRIVSSISLSIGKPIEIDNMKGSMNGFRPEVVISGLRILDPDSRKTLLRFEQLRHRDAEKVVRGLLDYAQRANLSARR